ncbi:hypothetical protein HW132_31865 [Brasilonema sp. CT11]|nr:hypothetical protein [Brasilonema sp. CT11]
MTLEATKVVDYFKRAKVQAPKGLHDLKKAKSLKGMPDDALVKALAELVERGILLVMADRDSQITTWMLAAVPQ